MRRRFKVGGGPRPHACRPTQRHSQLQAAAIQAVWSPERNNCCREVIFTILLPGHLIDPVQAIPYGRLTVFVTALQRRTELRDCLSHGHAPPIAAAKATWVCSAW